MCDRELPPIPPPAYESIVHKDNDRHEYLRPGAPPLEEIQDSSDLPAYLEPRRVPSDENNYAIITEDGLYLQPVPPKPIVSEQPFNQPFLSPSAPAPQPRNPKYKLCICFVIFLGILILLALISVAMLLYMTNTDTQGRTLENHTVNTTTMATFNHDQTSGTRVPTTGKPEVCEIRDNLVGIAVPVFSSSGGYTTRNCYVCPEERCANEVHVIAMYTPEGSRRGFQQEPDVVPDVPVNIINSKRHLPISLVLSSYEAANWIVTVPSDITVDHVFLMAYYQRHSDVQVFSTDGTQLTNFRLHLPASPYTYLDHRGRKLTEITETMTSQYGCFTSFSGRYKAQSWTLNLDAESCGTDTTAPSPSPSTTEIEHRDCSTNPCAHGRCTESGAGPFLCICSQGYYGERCENIHKAQICDIQDGTMGIATPASGSSTRNCYVCQQQSCASEVHMIAMYEPEGRVRGFQQNPSVIPDVPVRVISTTRHIPLTLVLSTYEATNWVVTLPENITVEHVFLMGYYVTYSSVKVLHENGTEDKSFRLHLPADSHYYMDHRGTGAPPRPNFGYGCSSCKGVDDVDAVMTSQFGCFTSFSGVYRAKSWTLDLEGHSCTVR